MLSLTLVWIALCVETRAGEVVWDGERLKGEVPGMRWVEGEDAGKIRSLIYEGEFGTEVFAFYASPETLGEGDGGRVPGIVLVHGGGGTAFSEWVWMWAKRGYAAIAMDLSGRRPVYPEVDAEGNFVKDMGAVRETRLRLEKGGPEAERPEKFDSIGGTVEDDWPYHAIANVMRAHSLLRSFEEVDEERTAITGISWGGYTACIAASVDDRFAAAVPVYGCGFLHEGESVQKPAIDALGPERAAEWVAKYDPGSHLGRCTVPMMFVNGTNDIHYVLDSYAKSYGEVKGEKVLRIALKMRHGHGPGWAPEEIGIFVDSKCKGGVPLAKVGKMTVEGGRVVVPFESETEIVSAKLHYTEDEGLRSKREWVTVEGVVGKKEVVVEGLPAGANTWVVELVDARGAMVSSEVGFR